MLTLKNVQDIEAAAHKAWDDAFPTQNFPYDLDVRFGILEIEVQKRPEAEFTKKEAERLVGKVKQLERMAVASMKYRAEYPEKHGRYYADPSFKRAVEEAYNKNPVHPEGCNCYACGVSRALHNYLE